MPFLMIVCIKPRLCREILSQLSAILLIRQPTSTNYLSYTMVLNEHKKGRAQKKQAGFYEGQKVALLISDRTDMGFIALINGTEKGILYKSEVFQPLKIGQEIDGFIKKVRDDKKIDLCLQKPGYNAIGALSQKIMDKLQQRGGFIAVTDKSQPKVIADIFGVSKKTFKKAIGNLYKKRLITLEKDGIRLRTAGASN
jgi:uncharacterized protein